MKTDEISFELFKQYKSIDTVVQERGLKISTIRDHLLQHIPDPNLPMDIFMSQQTFDEIAAAYKVLYNPTDPSGISLKTIKESVSNNIGYDNIKIACRFLESRPRSLSEKDATIKRIVL